MACVQKVLIIGGGIAGLAAAIALSRAGVECEVVELAGAPLGASLAIAGRAAEALDELGVYDACCATGRPFGPESEALMIWDAAGNLIGPGPSRPQWPGAKDNVAVYRPTLLGIMEEAADRLGARIQRRATASAIADDGERATVTFADGRQGVYDLVIGADGIGSRTRTMVFPDAPKPTYVGQLSIRWMSPGRFDHPEGWYLGPAGRVGYYYLPHQDLLYVPAEIDYPNLDRLTAEQVYALFKNLLDSFTAPAIQALRERLTPEADLIGRPFEWILVPESWHRGSVLLIGDAAHATTAHMGMGGGMALEDAAVLGQCVATSATRTKALESFMARRFERVRTVVETSVQLSRLQQQKAPPSENRALLERAFNTLAEPY